MRLSYDLIIIDVEFNQPSGKLLELGAVKLLRDGGIHPSSFSRLIQINEPISSYITNLTGIEETAMITASPLSEVLSSFQAWVHTDTKNVILCSWGNYDIVKLREAYLESGIKYPFRNKSFDIKSIIVWLGYFFNIKSKSDGLGSMLKAWNINFEGNKHRARDDAYNTAKLLQTTWRYFDLQKERILKALSNLGIGE